MFFMMDKKDKKHQSVNISMRGPDQRVKYKYRMKSVRSYGVIEYADTYYLPKWHHPYLSKKCGLLEQLGISA